MAIVFVPEDFLIQKGQMDGVPPELAFEFGVEFGLVAVLLQQPQEISVSIHAGNCERLAVILKKSLRDFSFENDESIPDGNHLRLSVKRECGDD